MRGTNPVDIFDWLFGDFLPHRQVPWHPVDNGAAAGARVSLSTALGLKILLNMRAENVPETLAQPGRFDFLFDLGWTERRGRDALRVAWASELPRQERS